MRAATSRAGSSRGRAAAGARRATGFTLVELLVTLAVVALLVAVAVPRFGAGTPRTEARAAVRTVIAALRLTRDTALGAESGVRAVFDVDARTVSVPGERQPRRLPPGIDVSLITARSELGEDGVGAVRFFADGSSTGARVRLGNAASTWIIDVDWLSGRITSRELDADEIAASNEVRVAWDRVASQ